MSCEEELHTPLKDDIEISTAAEGDGKAAQITLFHSTSVSLPLVDGEWTPPQEEGSTCAPSQHTGEIVLPSANPVLCIDLNSPVSDDVNIESRPCSSSTSRLSESPGVKSSLRASTPQSSGGDVSSASIMQTSSVVKQPGFTEKLVARELIHKLCKSNGHCTFLPEQWDELYQVVSSKGNEHHDHMAEPIGNIHGTIPTLVSFVARYTHIFSLIERSDDGLMEIRAHIRLEACISYLRKKGLCEIINCRRLHCCPSYLMDNCQYGDYCHVSHNLTIEHNANLLRRHLVDDLPIQDLAVLLSARIPQICYHHNYSADGCKRGERCHMLHICREYIGGKCSSADCERGHDILAAQPRAVLSKCNGFNVDRERDKVLSEFRTQLASVKLDQAQRNEAVNKQKKVCTSTSSIKLPDICIQYNTKDGCHDNACQNLHICRFYVLKKCTTSNCKRCHDLISNQSKPLLIRSGIDILTMDERGILDKLREQLNTLHKQQYDREMSNPERKDPKICLFNLIGRCVYMNNDCYDYHSPRKLPYQWQWYMSPNEGKYSNEWNDFCPSANADIESTYCDAAADQWNGSDYRIGRDILISFEGMNFRGETWAGKVRRLSTVSKFSTILKGRYVTVWIWYLLSDHESWQVISNDTISNSSSSDAVCAVNSMSISDEIESIYFSNPDAVFLYYTGEGDDVQQFVIDFKRMTLTNQITRDTSKLRRRPDVYHSHKK